uniref:recombinase family protein n=1 Tax=Candidatus Nitrotoga sp. M5 TaxID=2890409 RepID=UPI00273A19B2|nr:recombinase family protein [Candidatus Nitrotoga sp. M5]
MRSPAEPWADTTSLSGRMVLTIFAGIADFERSLIIERTSAGRAAAKAKGVRFGPKPVLTPEQIKHARGLIGGGAICIRGLASDRGSQINTLPIFVTIDFEVVVIIGLRYLAFFNLSY